MSCCPDNAIGYTCRCNRAIQVPMPLTVVVGIQDDVNALYEQGHTIKEGALVYLVNPVDSLHARRGEGIPDACPSGTWRLYTAAGPVDIVSDSAHPRRGYTRIWRCVCSTLFLDNSHRTGECQACMQRRVTATLDTSQRGLAQAANDVQREFERVAALYNAGATALGSWAEHRKLMHGKRQWVKPLSAEERHEHEREFAAQQALAITRTPFCALIPDEGRTLLGAPTVGELQTSFGPIKMKVDATMGRGEMRMEYLDNAEHWRHAQAVRDEPSGPAPPETRPAYLKHGPGGLGGSGPCDAGCRKCAAECAASTSKPVDPLDAKHDGKPLRDLLIVDEHLRNDRTTVLPDHVLVWAAGMAQPFTWAQRAAISAHWSAELRAKVAATKAADAERIRNRVTITHEED